MRWSYSAHLSKADRKMVPPLRYPSNTFFAFHALPAMDGAAMQTAASAPFYALIKAGK